MNPIRLQILAAALIASGTVHAATIAGFGDGSAFTINTNGTGTNASITAGTLTLTTAENNEARSVYATAKQDITNFTTTFRYQNGNAGAGADGFVFTIQNAGINALGGPGGNLAYNSLGTSVAVAFRIFGDDKTSVGSNGNTSNLLANLDTTPVNLLNLADITIAYNGTNLSYTVTNPNNVLQTFTRNVNVDIPAIVGANTAFIGFTGSTGGENATQTLSNFNFTSIPEPSAALLGAVGAMALLLRRRA